jgi:hypothetical protein
VYDVGEDFRCVGGKKKFPFAKTHTSISSLVFRLCRRGVPSKVLKSLLHTAVRRFLRTFFLRFIAQKIF